MGRRYLEIQVIGKRRRYVLENLRVDLGLVCCEFELFNLDLISIVI